MRLSDHHQGARLIRDFYIHFERVIEEGTDNRLHSYLFGHLLSSSLSHLTTLEFVFEEGLANAEPPQVPRTSPFLFRASSTSAA